MSSILVELSKNVLQVPVGQKTANLHAVKVGGLKTRFYHLAHHALCGGSGWILNRYDHSQSLTAHNFAALCPAGTCLHL